MYLFIGLNFACVSSECSDEIMRMRFCKFAVVLFCKNVFATVSSSHVYRDVKFHGGAAINLAVLKLIFSAWVRLIYLLKRVYQVAVTKNNNLNKMKKD